MQLQEVQLELESMNQGLLLKGIDARQESKHVTARTEASKYLIAVE